MSENLVPSVLLVILLAAVAAFTVWRNRKIFDDARRGWCAPLFADHGLDVLMALVPERMGSLFEAAQALAFCEFDEGRRRVEHPDVAREWSAEPEYWWALAQARLMTGEEEDRAAALATARQALALPGLRARAVAQAWSVLRELGESKPPGQVDRVLGVVAEVGKRKGDVAFAAYADGEAARMWAGGWKDGLAVYGGGPDGRPATAEIRAAAAALVRAAGAAAAEFGDGDGSHPLPAAGCIRFTLFTPGGTRAAEAAQRDVEKPAHPLHGVYAAMQRLAAAVRDQPSASPALRAR